MRKLVEKEIEDNLLEKAYNEFEINQRIACLEDIIGRYMFAKDKSIYTQEFKEQLIDILELVNLGDFDLFKEEYDGLELIEKEILISQEYDISKLNYYW